jgi:hypothetical protein
MIFARPVHLSGTRSGSGNDQYVAEIIMRITTEDESFGKADVPLAG